MIRVFLAAAFALVASILTTTAQAGVADDVRRGDCVYFDSFRFRMRGEVRGKGDFCLHKAAGGLDATLNVRDLGLDRDLFIAMTGEIRGDTIAWRFDQGISPGIDVAPFHWVDGVRGEIVIRFATAPFPGRDCDGRLRTYSVAGTVDSGTWIEVKVSHPFGHWWEAASELQIDALGGIERPGLVDFTAPAEICTSSELRTVNGQVRIIPGAPSAGTPVELSSSAPDLLRAGGLTVVGGGRGIAAVPMLVRATRPGPIRVTARVGGVSVERTVTVRACPSVDLSWLPRLHLAWRECAFCGSPRVNQRGDLVADLFGTGVVLTEKEGFRKLSEVIGTNASPRAITEAGRVAAFAADQGATLLATIVEGEPAEIESYDGIEALAVTEAGIVVGRDGKGRPVLTGPTGQVGLPFAKDDAQGEIVAMNGLGWVAGTLTADKRGFLFDGAQRIDIPDLGGGESRVLALGELGHVVGTARNKDGAWRAFVFTRKGGIEDRGLDGYERSEAIAVDVVGNVIVAAYRGDQRDTFLVGASGKARRAKELTEKAEVGELLGFSPSGSLLVRGVVDGEAGLFELVPGEAAK